MNLSTQNETKIIVCPVCKTAVSHTQTTCPSCQEDLGPLLLVYYQTPRYYNEGLRLARENKADEAIAALLAALSFEPANIETLVVLGKLHAQQQQYNQAVSYWQRTLSLDPDNVKAKAGIRRVHALQKRHHQRDQLRKLGATLLAVTVLLVAVAASYQFGTAQNVPLEPVIADSVLVSESPSERLLPTPTLALVETNEPGNTTPLSALKQTVQEVLQSNSDLALFAIDVQQIESGIELTGSVPTFELKELAIALAHGVVGVEWVDALHLEITPFDLAPIVQDMLATDNQLQGSTIAVKQTGDTIYLSGVVSSVGLKQYAEDLVGGVAGVGSVDSRELQIITPSLIEAVQQALQTDSRTAGLEIEVAQMGQSIQLTGIVSSLETRSVIESITREVAGVELVDAGDLRVALSAVEYVVQEGDSLASIARLFYGQEHRWPLIYETNRDVIFSFNLLRPGMRLTIPVDPG